MPNLLTYILISNNWPNNFDVIGQFFKIVLTFAFVLILAFFVTRFISSAYVSRNKSYNMRIIESIGVGHNSVIQLLKVGTRFYLIGITKEKITFLSEVNDADIDINSLYESTSTPFEKYLSSVLRKGSKSDE